MNKASLIEKIASISDMSKAEAERVVEGVFNTITEELKGGGEVSIAGFGIFSVRDRAARTARNPRTGEPVNVPATIVAKFKPAKALKDAVKPQM